jgi:hypothetical protein
VWAPLTWTGLELPSDSGRHGFKSTHRRATSTRQRRLRRKHQPHHNTATSKEKGTEVGAKQLHARERTSERARVREHERDHREWEDERCCPCLMPFTNKKKNMCLNKSYSAHSEAVAIQIRPSYRLNQNP